MPRPKPDLEALRARIAALEKRPALADGAISSFTRTCESDQNGTVAELLSVPPGVLHEIFTDEQRHSGAALGFTLGLARSLIRGGRQVLIYLQLVSDVNELGLPYGIGLNSFGFDPDRLIIGRINTLPELLWAMEEAIACRAVAGVIADIADDHKILDFTVSRRLSIRAAAAGTSAFLIRYGRGREASAAKLRWRVSPIVSAEAEFDPLAPGLSRFVIEIEKRRLGSKVKRAEGKSIILDWSENGFVPVSSSSRQPASVRVAAPSSRPIIAALGDRLSKAG